MYDDGLIRRLTAYISKFDGINSKEELKEKVKDEFQLQRDRSVYYRDEFAIRFSQSAKGSRSNSNTVLSLSALLNYDDRPAIDCMVTPEKNYQLLMNTSFLKKISQTSQKLRTDNIRGSFNFGDIMYEIDGIKNEPSNFERLFAYHARIPEAENIERIVEATNGIQGRVEKTNVDAEGVKLIMESVERTAEFLHSPEYDDLLRDLNQRAEKMADEIAIASSIDNVNVRGRAIEFLITEEKSTLKDELVSALKNGNPIPKFKTEDNLGDFGKEYSQYNTETDIKTKLLDRNSGPKAYNVDKLLKFMLTPKSVYLMYLLGIDENKYLIGRLVSPFDTRLLDSTNFNPLWVGRNSRGVAQFTENGLKQILAEDNHSEFDVDRAKAFVRDLIDK